CSAAVLRAIIRLRRHGRACPGHRAEERTASAGMPCHSKGCARLRGITGLGAPAVRRPSDDKPLGWERASSVEVHSFTNSELPARRAGHRKSTLVDLRALDPISSKLEIGGRRARDSRAVIL